MDLEAGTLSVRHALQRTGGEWHLIEPKSATSRRTISLPSAGAAALWRQRAQQKAEREAAAERWRQEWPLIFTTSVGTPLSNRNVSRDFYRLQDKAGLKRWLLRDLRHGCASLLLAEGASPRTISEILGHSGIGITMDTYAHLAPELKREAARMMDHALSLKKQLLQAPAPSR